MVASDEEKAALKQHPIIGKYAKIHLLTRAPVGRLLQNMFEDGVDAAEIERFRVAFDEDYEAPAVAAAAPAAGGGMNKEALQAALAVMEKSICSKMERAIAEREERILAAIAGAGSSLPARSAAAAATAASVPVPTMASLTIESAPAPAPASPKAAPEPRASAPKREKKPVVAEAIESNLASKDMSTWEAMKGIQSTSGIQLEMSCKAAYDRVRKDRNGVRWAMFEFDSKFAWIYPTKEGMATDDFIGDWEGLVELLPEKKACYVLYNFEYEQEGGGGYAQAGMNVMKNKMTLFSWTDSKCKVKDRMVAASSQSAIKQICRGACDEACYDKEDMTFEAMCKLLDCN